MIIPKVVQVEGEAIELMVSSWESAMLLLDDGVGFSLLKGIAEYHRANKVSLRYNGGKPLEIKIEERETNMLAQLNSENFEGLSGLVSAEWLRLAEWVLSQEGAIFVVRMNRPRNLLFNQAACDLLNMTPEQMLGQELNQCWERHLRPLDYSAQLHPEMAEIHRLLRVSDSGQLSNHRYENWKSDGGADGSPPNPQWVEWQGDILYREILGNDYRIMKPNVYRLK